MATVAANLDLQLRGEGIDDRHADTVQASGELVVVAVELPARVQPSEDEFHA